MILSPTFLRRVTKVLHKFRGTRNVAEFIRGRFAETDQSLVVEDFDRKGKFRVNLKDHIGSHIYWFGGYNLDIAEVLKRELSPGMVVLDVGANVGEISIVAAHRVGASGQVFAFEPLSSARGELEKNLELNPGVAVEIAPVGLSDKVRTADVFTNMAADDAGAVNHGLASLYPQVIGVRRPAEKIELTTLDTWAEEANPERIDLIKVDVEGEELPVLKGAAGTLRKFRPKLIVEVQRETCESAGYSTDDILKFLGQFRYKFYRIRRGGRIRSITIDDLSRFQNVLCVPQ